MRTILLIISLLMSGVTFAADGVSFKEVVWDFGVIEELGGNVNHSFSFENGGDTPVVIHDVVASCGCTTPKYDRRPIMSGQSSVIEISFDPKYRPGRFVKEVYVYMSGNREPILLKVQGVVTERVLSIEERYPFNVGEGVRISTLYATVRGVRSGERVMSAVEYINTSDQTLDIEFVPRKSNNGLDLNFSRRLNPNQSVAMSVGYEHSGDLKISDRLRDTVDIYINGVAMTRVLYVIGRPAVD